MKRLPGVVYASAVVALASAAALTGCASDNPYELPEYQPGQAAGQMAGSATTPPAEGGSGEAESGQGQTSDGASETGSTPGITREPTPASTDVIYSPADARGEGAWVEKGRVKAKTEKGRAASDAVLAYMAQRVQLSNTWVVDEAGLDAVATGQAASSARGRALSQQAAGRRSVGRFVVNVSSAKVVDDRATVTGCHFDSTSEVDENGQVLVSPPGGVLITMEVQFAQGVWRVATWPTKPVPTCTGWQK